MNYLNKTVKALCLTALATFTSFSTATAQTDDPTIMVINGQNVPRSEFEYSYNKNNSEGVIDKKSVEEYVDLFINYKLKVQAAIDAHYDTLQSFKDEFAQYRDQQVKPLVVTDADIEKEAHKIYDQTAERIGPDGLVQVAHILIGARQKDSEEKWKEARQRIDSIAAALKDGADFAELAKKYSQDPGSARQGGLLPFVQRGQLVKEFENAAFAMKDSGEVSPVIETAYGFHIIQFRARKQLEPYEFHHEGILRFIEQRNLREQIAEQKIDSIVKTQAGITKKDYMNSLSDEMAAKDDELKYLIQEYHDGLLLYEISNELVWDKAAKDEAGLANYFKRHRKDDEFKWEKPRFKGMAYHVKDKATVKAVAKSVKGLPFDQWAEKLRTTFNGDSVIRIRVEKGIFREGDNALIDSIVFKKDTTVSHLKDYPIDAVHGKLLKGPEEYGDVRGQVVTGYQAELEKAWIDELRSRYTFSVNRDVLETVNKH